MFETSIILSIKQIIINFIVPLVPGVLFLWIIYWTKIKWILLLILWWFIGTWLIAARIFNLQIFHFWIGKAEYIVLLVVLVLIFIIKSIKFKNSLSSYIKTLKNDISINDIKQSYKKSSKIKRVIIITSSIIIWRIVVITWIHTITMPTYSEDSFVNWNQASINMYQDWWMKITWQENEILGRGRLWYPIHMPIYKTTISKLLGWFYDIWINLRQRYSLIWLLIFVFTVTFFQTKNLFASILPWALICSLPLIYFHTTDWYLDLACAIYSILTIRAFYQYQKNNDLEYLSLWILLWVILANIKNTSIVLYLPTIVISLLIFLAAQKKLIKAFKEFFKEKKQLYLSIFYIAFFTLPFIIIKLIHNLGYNQAAYLKSWVWLSSTIHREIFSIFPRMFFKTSTYNIILIILLLIICIAIYNFRKTKWELLLIITPLLLFINFIIFFLFTENYLYALDQTAINRFLVMSFVVFLWFSWYFFNLSNKDNS